MNSYICPSCFCEGKIIEDQLRIILSCKNNSCKILFFLGEIYGLH